MDIVESNEFDSSAKSDCEDGTVERSLCSKNSKKATSYLIPNTRQAFT